MRDYIDIEAIKVMVPDGWELVRVGVPREGELAISLDGTHVAEGMNNGQSVLRIIVKRKRWRAEKWGSYWAINTIGEVICDVDDCSVADNKRYKFGNYYQTREEAEAAAVRVMAAYRGGE